MIEMTTARPMVERQEAKPMETWRCAQCGRILAKLRLGPGSTIEVKCKSCNTFSLRTVDLASQI